MGSLSVRNLDNDVIEKLRDRAKKNHRSLEAEVRRILTDEANEASRGAQLRALAEQIAAMTPDAPQTDSTILLREDRDR